MRITWDLPTAVFSSKTPVQSNVKVKNLEIMAYLKVMITFFADQVLLSKSHVSTLWCVSKSWYTCNLRGFNGLDCPNFLLSQWVCTECTCLHNFGLWISLGIIGRVILELNSGILDPFLPYSISGYLPQVPKLSLLREKPWEAVTECLYDHTDCTAKHSLLLM